MFGWPLDVVDDHRLAGIVEDLLRRVQGLGDSLVGSLSAAASPWK
jgi:hypothetical protein